MWLLTTSELYFSDARCRYLYIRVSLLFVFELLIIGFQPCIHSFTVACCEFLTGMQGDLF